MGAEDAINQDGAFEQGIVTGRHNSQMVFLAGLAVHADPIACCFVGRLEAVEEGIQARTANW